jgi:sulfatase maturation enzyme AslB (radical SAM superfamily)
MIQDKVPLCYAPFIGMYATGYDQYAPCCVAKKDTYKNVMPNDYWTSKEMQAMREQVLNGKWPDKCSFCKNKAEKNLKDERWMWDKRFSQLPSQLNVDKIDLDIVTGNSTLAPTYLDYRPSNKCNLKCRMCVPNASSQITTEFQLHENMQQWFSAPNKTVTNFEDFKLFASNAKLTNIKILGGEPTIDPLVLDFLEAIIENYETLPTLRFTTNGTNLNRRFRNIMEKFPDIHVQFSVDAVNNVYDYIRSNGNWEKTKSIILELFESNLANTYGFNVVLMPYNIFHLTDLLDWFVELELLGYDFDVFYDASEGYTTELNAILPEHLQGAKDMLTEWQRNNSYDISSILKILDSTEFDKLSFDRFINYNNSLDTIRNTTLLTLDERFKHYV